MRKHCHAPQSAKTIIRLLKLMYINIYRYLVKKKGWRMVDIPSLHQQFSEEWSFGNLHLTNDCHQKDLCYQADLCVYRQGKDQFLYQ